MTMPFYVSPEQLMKDRADYARKGIARGRSVVVLGYEGGIAFVAENPSRALHKVSEIYDRVAFAAVGKYNEFENLRVAGVRYADLRGYSYDRADVTARGLANAYAQTLGTVFTQESKPYEVEIAVAEVGTRRGERPDLPADVRRVGGRRAGLRGDGRCQRAHQRGAEGALARRDDPRRRALGWRWSCSSRTPAGGPARTLTPAQLEVAVLDRERPRRTFRRIAGPLLDRLLSARTPPPGCPARTSRRPGRHDTLSQGQQDGHAPPPTPRDRSSRGRPSSDGRRHRRDGSARGGRRAGPRRGRGWSSGSSSATLAGAAAARGDGRRRDVRGHRGDGAGPGRGADPVPRVRPRGSRPDLGAPQRRRGRPAGRGRAGGLHLVHGCGAAGDLPYARDHAATELAIREAGLSLTAMRSALYADMAPLFVGADGVIRAPAGDGRVAWVARRDVARLAAVLLTGEGHRDQVYDVSGPVAIDLHETARLLADASGRRHLLPPRDAGGGPGLAGRPPRLAGRGVDRLLPGAAHRGGVGDQPHDRAPHRHPALEPGRVAGPRPVRLGPRPEPARRTGRSAR